MSGDKKNGLERAASSIFTFFLATIPYELGWLEVKWPKLWDPIPELDFDDPCGSLPTWNILWLSLNTNTSRF